MSISNELSSEIAVTLLESKALQDSREAQEILFLVHSTLQKLSAKEQPSSFKKPADPALPNIKGAAFGAS